MGLGTKALPAVGMLVRALDLTELDLSVNAFNGVDEWGEPRSNVADEEEAEEAGLAAAAAAVADPASTATAGKRAGGAATGTVADATGGIATPGTVPQSGTRNRSRLGRTRGAARVRRNRFGRPLAEGGEEEDEEAAAAVAAAAEAPTGEGGGDVGADDVDAPSAAALAAAVATDAVPRGGGAAAASAARRAAGKWSEGGALLSLAAAATGTSAADWQWDRGGAMRTFGRVLASCSSLRTLAIQHTAARARCGVCVASALMPGTAPTHGLSADAPGRPLGLAALQTLNLQGTAISETALQELTTALGQPGRSGPVSLNLEGSLRRAHAALPALWAWLREGPSPVRQLNLGFNALPSGGELGAALAANRTLAELDLGANGELGAIARPEDDEDEGGQPAAAGGRTPGGARDGRGGRSVGSDAEEEAPKVTAAMLARLEAGVGALCAGLQQRCSLRSLDLSYIPLGEPGAQRLAAVLITRQCALTALRLDGCDLGPKGAAALAASLADLTQCAPLRTLRLEYNGIGPEGTKRLAAAIPQRASLQALFLGCNAIREEGARALGGALGTSASLRTLDVGDNALDVTGLRLLLEGVRAQNALTAFDLSNNVLGDVGAETLASELRANPALQFVRVNGNRVGEVGGASLAAAVDESANEALLLDARHNYSIAYRDSLKIRMSNLRRRHSAGASPLDGMGAKDAMVADE